MTPAPREKPSVPEPSAMSQAGIAGTPLEDPHLNLRELTGMAVLRLHSLEEPAALAAGLAQAGVNLPLDTNGAAGEAPSVICLRPGEWLLLARGRPVADLMGQISGRVNPSLTALLNLSDGLAVFRLSGAASPWLLGKLCGLDLLAGTAAGQHGARTRIGEIAVVLHFRPGPDGVPRFDLVFDRSVAPYLWGLLIDAAPHAGELFAAHGTAA